MRHWNQGSAIAREQLSTKGIDNCPVSLDCAATRAPPLFDTDAAHHRAPVSVKPSDMVRDHDWFLTLVDQVWKTKAVAIGGILKYYLREQEKEHLVSEPGEENVEAAVEQLFFGWKQQVKRYRRLGK